MTQTNINDYIYVNIQPVLDGAGEPTPTQLSTETFNSIDCHNKRIYAAILDKASVHVFEQSDDTYREQRFPLPKNHHTYLKLVVNERGIYFTSYTENVVGKMSLDGSPEYGVFEIPTSVQHGNETVGPRLCHSDEEGSILIAGHRSNELYVLENESEWSSVRVEGLEKPECALYLPGRLYVCSEGVMTLYLPETS